MLFDHFLFPDESAHTKVTDFDGELLIQQDVIEFYVAVQDCVMMTMGYAFDYLFENAFGFVLADSAGFLDFCEEIT